MDKRRIFTVGGTLIAALATGHIMQNGNAVAARFDTAEVDRAKPLLARIAESPDLPADPGRPKTLGITSEAFSNRFLATLDMSFDSDVLTDAPTPMFETAICEPRIQVTAANNAMMQLDVSAPCQLNQRIVVSHAGLTFADLLPEGGMFNIMLPALTADSDVTVDLGGDVLRAPVPVPATDISNVAVVSWHGGPALHIAPEVWNSDTGQPTGNVLTPTQAEIYRGLDGGSYVIRYGNADVADPIMAEVFIFEQEDVPKTGLVRLGVEADVTDQSCGTEIVGQTTQVLDDGQIHSGQITLAMPECDGVGGFLVLNNLLLDLKIAAN